MTSLALACGGPIEVPAADPSALATEDPIGGADAGAIVTDPDDVRDPYDDPWEVPADGGSPDVRDGGGCRRRDAGSPRCVPTTCEDEGKDCGEIPDGCGGTLFCGSCGCGERCGAQVPNECGPRGSSCVPVTCAKVVRNCGTLSDGCGGTLFCGTCGGGQSCGGGGTPNKCGGSS